MTRKQADYIEFGSEKHAWHKGLRKATKEDTLEYHGWTLQDMTVAGPLAMLDDMAYLRELLRQKVDDLEGGPPPAPQSDDPLAPNYAPPLWIPPEDQMLGG